MIRRGPKPQSNDALKMRGSRHWRGESGNGRAMVEPEPEPQVDPREAELLTGFPAGESKGWRLEFIIQRRAKAEWHKTDEVSKIRREYHAARRSMRRHWATVRDRLLSRWAEEYPGTRPWAWWEFDTDEPRRLLSGPGNSLVRNRKATWWQRQLWFGAPNVIARADIDTPSVYETERQYLERLGLMVDDDRANDNKEPDDG